MCSSWHGCNNGSNSSSSNKCVFVGMVVRKKDVFARYAIVYLELETKTKGRCQKHPEGGGDLQSNTLLYLPVRVPQFAKICNFLRSHASSQVVLSKK